MSVFVALKIFSENRVCGTGNAPYKEKRKGKENGNVRRVYCRESDGCFNGFGSWRSVNWLTVQGPKTNYKNERRITMKMVDVKTKNGGTIKVESYESVEEYIKAHGKENTLTALNRIHRVDAVNAANRKQSLTAKLKAAIKAGTVTEAQVKALLK